MIPKSSAHKPDYFLMALIFTLTVFGLVMLASASSEMGEARFDDGYFYIKHQIYNGLAVGIIGFLVGYLLHYKILRKFAFIFLIIGIISLLLVFTDLGLEVRGAQRWINIGSVSIQPAEIMKIVFIIYLAAWLSNPKTKRTEEFGRGMLPFMLISGLIATLLLIQPNTSTTVILLGSALVVYFLSGAKLKYVFAIIMIGVVSLAAITYATPYRRSRVAGYFSPKTDTAGQNYHINQALFAIASGGITGVGYGQSTTKANYLPAPIDDSIFAVIAEELGFIGSGILISLFAMLVFRFFWLAKKTRDNFGRLILVGFGSIIGIQSLMNIAAISGFIPLTGVPLPFVSYGGTALAAFLTMGGISLNISKYA